MVTTGSRCCRARPASVSMSTSGRSGRCDISGAPYAVESPRGGANRSRELPVLARIAARRRNSSLLERSRPVRYREQGSSPSRRGSHLAGDGEGNRRSRSTASPVLLTWTRRLDRSSLSTTPPSRAVAATTSSIEPSYRAAQVGRVLGCQPQRASPGRDCSDLFPATLHPRSAARDSACSPDKLHSAIPIGLAGRRARRCRPSDGGHGRDDREKRRP
jgi:hypothetical protein